MLYLDTEPPKPPILGIVNISWTNVTVNWTKAPNTFAVQQYLLSYKYINVSKFNTFYVKKGRVTNNI